MLTTSYAWYSFSEGSTTFSAVTNNDDVIVSFQRGEYISTSIAVPIKEADIDKYSEKNNFTIRVKDNSDDNEMLVTVSLVDVVISEALQDVNFKIDLYHQSKSVASVTGDALGLDDEATSTLGTVALENNIDNNFELRVYILDDNSNQSAMMNKTFQAKIKVDVTSRLKTTMNDYGDSDIYISSIVIDGESSDTLPVQGYYTMYADCDKGSSLTWDSLSKTITYASGSYIKDSCNLTFISSTDYPLLSEMPVGSYVQYTGTNGCSGKRCEGQNVNYDGSEKMGYCNDMNNQFVTSGWRIGYIENNSVYLVSAGALDCVSTDIDSNTDYLSKLDNMALKYCNENYVRGGICNAKTVWSFKATDFEKMTGSVLSSESCYNQYSNKLCGYTNDLIDNGGDYWISASSVSGLFYWDSAKRYINLGISGYSYGVRAVIILDASVVVMGGTGTYSNPYTIGIVK